MADILKGSGDHRAGAAGPLNHVANGMLACSDTLVGFCNVFEFQTDLRYDSEQMQADLNTYGVFSYEEWSDYVTEEQFYAFNGPYFKIALAKGLLTKEELFSLIRDVQLLWAQ